MCAPLTVLCWPFLQEVDSNIRSLATLLVDLVGLRLRLAAATTQLAVNRALPWLPTAAAPPAPAPASQAAAADAAAGAASAASKADGGLIGALQAVTPAQLQQALQTASAKVATSVPAVAAATKLQEATASTSTALDAVRAQAVLHRTASRSNSPEPAGAARASSRGAHSGAAASSSAAPLAAYSAAGAAASAAAAALHSHPLPDVDLDTARFSPLPSWGPDEQVEAVTPVESDTVRCSAGHPSGAAAAGTRSKRLPGCRNAAPCAKCLCLCLGWWWWCVA
jgi:hypothetical protein